jgi:glutamate synthase (NADPH/NADH) small chain
MTDLTRRERMRLPRQIPAEQDPELRAGTFAEVNLGFTPHQAMLEAERCIECKRAPCVVGCPVGVRIHEFVPAVAGGDFAAAAAIIEQDNLLPAICGRVCPQETQCEGVCVLGRKYTPVAIGNLERFVADWQRTEAPSSAPARTIATGKQVAVVGSGPAGLACAADLIRQGHRVTVFEALHELGGVLSYGIPDYRLPREVLQHEIDGLADRGVTFVTNAVVGMTDTVDQLLEEEGFDAVFLGVGAGLPRFLGIPGEDLVGVYSANEFLTRVNLMRAYEPDAETPVLDVAGKRVAVFGGGNTAMDAVRTARRLGAAEAVIMYRRTEAEMPARREEIEHARQEAVRFQTLVAPIELLSDDSGRLAAVRLQRMRLGEPDPDGRCRPVPLPGQESVEAVSVAIVAVGNSPNPLIGKTTPDIAHGPRGTVVADPVSGRTTKRGVFAGGDITTGGATVILAMGAGRRAAAAIDEYLRTGSWQPVPAESPDTATEAIKA